jgi:hypothetical protein
LGALFAGIRALVLMRRFACHGGFDVTDGCGGDWGYYFLLDEAPDSHSQCLVDHSSAGDRSSLFFIIGQQFDDFDLTSFLGADGDDLDLGGPTFSGGVPSGWYIFLLL